MQLRESRKPGDPTDRKSNRLLRSITPPSGRDQPAQRPTVDAPTLSDGDPAPAGAL